MFRVVRVIGPGDTRVAKARLRGTTLGSFAVQMLQLR